VSADWTAQAQRRLILASHTVRAWPQVPDYLDIIKRPMDFSTMKRRLEDGVYDANFAALEADFQQIITNCMTYNAQGSDIYKQAVHVRKVGRRILHKFRKRHKDIAGEQSTVPEFAAEDLTDLESNGRASVRRPVSWTASPPARLRPI